MESVNPSIAFLLFISLYISLSQKANHIIEQRPVSSVPFLAGGSFFSLTPCSAGFRFNWMGSSPGGKGWDGSIDSAVLSTSLFNSLLLLSFGAITGKGLVMFIFILPLMAPAGRPTLESNSTLPSMKVRTSLVCDGAITSGLSDTFIFDSSRCCSPVI